MWNLDDEAEAAAAAVPAGSATSGPGALKPAQAKHDPSGLSSVPNLRDVASVDPTRLRQGVLLRCGTVDFCSAPDAETLVVRRGVRDRIDLRHAREMAVDGQSNWFRDASRAPRRCNDALRSRTEVQTHHLFVDGRPHFPDEAAAAAALAAAAEAARAVELAGAPGVDAEPPNLSMVGSRPRTTAPYFLAATHPCESPLRTGAWTAG